MGPRPSPGYSITKIAHVTSRQSFIIRCHEGAWQIRLPMASSAALRVLSLDQKRPVYQHHTHALCRRISLAAALVCLGLTMCAPRTSGAAQAEGARFELLPLRPFGVDLALRQSFTPHGREIGLQVGLTALHYANLEVRANYQYFGFAAPGHHTNVHSLYLNPRWNNFLDVLDFPSGKPLSQLLRHLLFGPLQDRAVPYVGGVLGSALTGAGNQTPTYLYGGQVGVRFPVAHSVSLDISLWFFAYGAKFEEHADPERQLLFTTGFVF